MTAEGESLTGQLVARNVRRYRQERRMSLGELARRSALSKQTLSKIEQGLGNPTVETLAQIGAALDIPARRLLTEWGTPVFVQRADAAARARPERVLDEVYGTGYVRTLILRLTRDAKPGDPPEPGSPGTLHHLYIISGKLRTGPLIDPVTVSAGDFVRFPGDVPYRHDCLSEQVVAHLVITVPQLHQFEAFPR
nr:XRE family transcriptional regulator [Mycobacterium talmoniae]